MVINSIDQFYFDKSHEKYIESLAWSRTAATTKKTDEQTRKENERKKHRNCLKIGYMDSRFYQNSKSHHIITIN